MSIFRDSLSMIGLFFVITQFNLSASNTYQQELIDEELNEEQLLHEYNNHNQEIRGFITSVITSSDPSNNNVSIDNQLIDTIRKTLVGDDGGGMIIDDLTSEYFSVFHYFVVGAFSVKGKYWIFHLSD
jgi:hypothetical protein